MQFTAFHSVKGRYGASLFGEKGTLQLRALTPLSAIASDAVEALLDAAFGGDRKKRTAYRMREGVLPIPTLSFALVDQNRLLGLLQCWPVRLVTPDDTATPLVLVGPVAVAPEAQGAGIGQQMMETMLSAADREGFNALMMIGDPEYYGRFFGFTADATAAWDVPGPVERHRLLARITRTGGLPAKGRIEADTAFALAATSA